MKKVLSINSKWQIEDDEGNTYTTEEARTMLEKKGVIDYTLSFQRLLQYNLDMNKLKEYYQEIR